MLHSFTVPKRDYGAIKTYLKKGITPMPEVIGRVYEIRIDDDIVATAEVSAERPVIFYAVSYGEQVFQRVVSQMDCRFEAIGITLAFDVDTSYD